MKQQQIKKLIETAFGMSPDEQYQRYNITELYISFSEFKELIKYICEVMND